MLAGGWGWGVSCPAQDERESRESGRATRGANAPLRVPWSVSRLTLGKLLKLTRRNTPQRVWLLVLDTLVKH